MARIPASANMFLVACICYSIAAILIILSCKRELSCEGCNEKNKPPIANAGPDQVITLPTDSVLLDGRQSSDPDGMISSYLWTKISGPASFTIVNHTDSITKVKSVAVGSYLFELKITDNGGLSAKDTIRVIVDSVFTNNHPPIANAGSDKTISLPTNTVNLDGSGSTDPENNISSYLWTQVSGPSSFNIVNANAVQTQVTNLVQGIYQFELKVSDNGGLSATDTMKVIVDSVSTANHPPIANAGFDTTITLPVNTIILDGRNSSDPENNITSYAWTKVSGPSSFNIINSNAVQTQVTNLVQGTYQFELKVTDAGNLFSKDTVQITVQIIDTPHLNCDSTNRPISNATLSLPTQLPDPRYGITVASAGNKIFIAGGYTSYTGNQPASFSSRVDIYDIPTGQWAITQLSEPCTVGAVAVLGGKIFFAGGSNVNGSRITVDVYDVSTHTWSIIQLSQARAGIAGGAIDNKVFFAGGFISFGQFSDRVDIYDVSTNSGSTASLSEGRYCLHDLEKITPTVVGQKIFFAGGSCNSIQDCSSNRIDIYDATANTWSSEFYVSPNGSLFPGIAAGNKNYFVTGDYWQGGSRVEIRDEVTHTTSYKCLSGTLYMAPFKNGNKLFFPVSTVPQYTSGWKLTHFDVYDLSTNTWSISKLPSFGNNFLSFVPVNNDVYAIEGAVTGASFLYNRIYKIDF